MKAIILAAGIGSRLRKKLPKSLIELPSGYTIIANQINLLRSTGINEIIVVSGFKKEVIMEECPDVLFCYNPFYHITNTSQSLKMAFGIIEEDDVIWLNGDVYLDKDVVQRVIEKRGNIIAVNNAECGEEEVKYRTDPSGKIVEISKGVIKAEGEAIGVNKIGCSDFEVFLESLGECSDEDYFEMGIEIAIRKGVAFQAVDVSDCACVEIDNAEDLEKIQE